MNRYYNILTDKKPLARSNNGIHLFAANNTLPKILFIKSYPPRECGIATYSDDLIKALENGFSSSFKIKVSPLENEAEQHHYTGAITNILNTDSAASFARLAQTTN